MMDQAIKDFAKQFSFKPKIENKQNFKKYKKFLVCGMGGSHLAADILKTINPSLDIIIWSDYGLPALPEKDLQKRLVIASSYSGNTEETVDAYHTAKEKNLPLLVIAVGGKLIELAQKNDTPYIELPNTGIQPRSALGFSLMAMAKAVGEKEIIKQGAQFSKTIKPADYESKGKELAQRLRGKIPVIYSSAKNFSVAYNWKIKLNETGKIPAFYNLLPELNHNEMNGFDVKEQNKSLYDKFYFIFLKDGADHPRLIKRMEILEKLYSQRSLPVEVLLLEGQNNLEKIFISLLIGDWTAFYIAEDAGLESEQVPMVEEFKKLIA